MQPQAVVFDIGNVLIEWAPERFFDQEIGPAQRKALFAQVDLLAMNDRVDMGEPFAETVAAKARAHPEWRDEIMLWHDRWLEMASPEISRSVRLMRALRTKGVPVFSLTNFGVETFEIARKAYPFLEEFDRPFVSGHLQMCKPDPQIYARLESESGVAPDALLFTDDRADNIAAAKARGWQTHLFENPEGWAACLVRVGLLSADEAR